MGAQDSLLGTARACALAASPAEFRRFSQACSRGNRAVPPARSCPSGNEGSLWPPQRQQRPENEGRQAPREHLPAPAGRCRRRRCEAGWPSPRPGRAPPGRPSACPVANGNNPEPAALGARLRRLGCDSPARSPSDWAGGGGTRRPSSRRWIGCAY